MPQLDNYLVTMGMKGQNLVLSQMEKIRKTGKALSKSKTVVDLVAKAGKGAGRSAPEKIVEDERKENEKVKRNHRQEEGEEKKNTSKLRDAVGRFGNGVQTFASSASSIDPVAAITGFTSALGTSLSGISVLGIGLGRLPEGIAAISNSALTMAKNAVDMGKQATAAYHQLADRNAAAEHYGGRVGQGPMSRNERAMFIDAVSGSMGKIQQPLADEINKLVGKKDTRALARVAAGDWESTGTDKGWMLGQLSSSFQGLPPSIKQKLQASLLKSNAGEIQGITDEQYGAQANAGRLADMEEKQTKRLYDKTLEGGSNGQTNANLIGMIGKMNDMQVTLYDTGLKFAKAINYSIDAIAAMPGEIEKFAKKLERVLDNAYVKKVTAVTGAPDKVRAYR